MALDAGADCIVFCLVCAMAHWSRGSASCCEKGWIVRSALLGVSMFFAMTLVSVLMTMLFPQWAQPQDISTVIVKAEKRLEWIAVIVVVSVFAPLSEEILFRGYIYHSLREKYSVIYSIIAASLLVWLYDYDLFPVAAADFGRYCAEWFRAGRFPLGIHYHAQGFEFYEYPDSFFLTAGLVT